MSGKYLAMRNGADMSDGEVIAEHGDRLRVVLVLDMDAGAPYDEGSSPLLRFDYGYHERWSMVDGVTEYGASLGADLWASLDEIGNDADAVEALLRERTGATAFQWWHSGDALYLTFDPADWREQTGAPAGSISMDEWRAYCEGSVYGYEVQELVTWQRVDGGDAGQRRETWEHVDSCYGFYGREYAEQSAREALADHAASGVAA